MRQPDPKEIAHLICLSIRADIDPRDADKAAGEIIAYLQHLIDDLMDLYGPLKPEQLRPGYYGPPRRS